MLKINKLSHLIKYSSSVRNSTRTMQSVATTTLKGLKFDNHFVKELPADPIKENIVREVKHSAYSFVDIVKGSPSEDPKLVSLSTLCAK